METILEIRLGFVLDGIYFGWHDGKLYQLPYTKNGKYFGLRTLRQKSLKKNGWVYYHIRRNKVGIEKLRAMLQQVNWDVNKPSDLVTNI
jgi:hypothetical protein